MLHNWFWVFIFLIVKLSLDQKYVYSKDWSLKVVLNFVHICYQVIIRTNFGHACDLLLRTIYEVG